MKQKLINHLLRYLLNTVTVDEIITSEKGQLKINGKVVTDNELKQLQAEAKALKGFRIWNIMTTSVRFLAKDKIFNKSTTFEHVTYGKSMLFNIDTIESIVEVVKNH